MLNGFACDALRLSSERLALSGRAFAGSVLGPNRRPWACASTIGARVSMFARTNGAPICDRVIVGIAPVQTGETPVVRGAGRFGWDLGQGGGGAADMERWSFCANLSAGAHALVRVGLYARTCTQVQVRARLSANCLFAKVIETRSQLLQ